MFLTILLEATYNSIVQGKWDEDVWRKVMALLNESHLSHDEVQSVRKFLQIIRLPTIVIPPVAVSIFDQIKPQSQKPPENQEENATIDAFLIAIKGISERLNGGEDPWPLRIDLELALKRLERREACPWVVPVAKYESKHGSMEACPTGAAQKEAWQALRERIDTQNPTTEKCVAEKARVKAIACPNITAIQPASQRSTPNITANPQLSSSSMPIDALPAIPGAQPGTAGLVATNQHSMSLMPSSEPLSQKPPENQEENATGPLVTGTPRQPVRPDATGPLVPGTPRQPPDSTPMASSQDESSGFHTPNGTSMASSQDGSSGFHTPNSTSMEVQAAVQAYTLPDIQKPPENQEENATGPLTPVRPDSTSMASSTKPKSNLNPLRGLVDWWTPQP